MQIQTKIKTNNCPYFRRNIKLWREHILSIKSNLILIKGKSGIGKSTLLKSLKSYYGKNSILVGGKFNVFEGTLEENILLGRKFNGDLNSYLEELFSKESRLKDKKVLISNSTLSSGQIQRIALLRDIIISKNKIILFDEPTSALDRSSELVISRFLYQKAEQMRIKKLIIVTHSSKLEKFMCGAKIVNLRT